MGLLTGIPVNYRDNSLLLWLAIGGIIAMKRQLLVIVSAILILIVGVVGIHPHSTPAVQVETKAVAAPTPPTRAELLALVNAERAKYNVAPLVEDTRLDQSALMKANDEVTYGYFGHISPANSPHAGKNSSDYIFGTGIVCVDSGENLTENTNVNDAKHAVDAWIASPPHHAAMIDPKNSLTGFGIDKDQIVEQFCQTQ